jgi:SH3-like domain-containing protein
MKLRTALLITVCLAPTAVWAAGPVNPSGLPLPRFVSLKSTEVNVRSGPGSRYPITWVYRRESMPVEVIEEFDHWRKIRDAEGTAGWVHKSMLEGRRNVMIRGKEPRTIRIDHEADAKPLVKAEPTVIAKLVECPKEAKDWCRIQVAGKKGWLEKKFLWGVYPTEIIE